jgi:hypothetical protein
VWARGRARAAHLKPAGPNSGSTSGRRAAPRAALLPRARSGPARRCSNI